jgi:hypothetical protein
MKLDQTSEHALSALTAGGALAAFLVLALVPAIPFLLP